MASPETMERRAAVELRLAAGGRKLAGYAAVFDAEADLGAFRERIAPGAFAASLAGGGDILCLVDHDPSALLGRTRTGTLRLAEDSRGLAFEVDIPDTTLGRDVLALAERGDLGGGSFGFLVASGGERWQGDLRTLTAVDLREISVVHAWPAYDATSVAARSRPGAGVRLALLRRRIEVM